MMDRRVKQPDPDLVNLAEQVGYWIRFVWNGRLYYRNFQDEIYESAAHIVYENRPKTRDWFCKTCGKMHSEVMRAVGKAIHDDAPL